MAEGPNSQNSSERRSPLPVGVVLSVLSLLAGFSFLPRWVLRESNPLSGTEAPHVDFQFEVNGPEGKATAALQEFRGQVLVLDFWASWCGPCRVETPMVDGLAKKWGGHNVRVVGVNTSDSRAQALAWVRDHGLQMPIVLDESGKLAQAFGVESLPTVVVVAPDGKVKGVRTGLSTERDLEALVRRAGGTL